jgi:hypothetical protein
MNSKICTLLTLFKILLTSALSWGQSFSFINQIEIPHLHKVDKTSVGGLSALALDESSGFYFAVSDDRGKYGDSRFYKFHLEQNKSTNDFKVTDLSAVVIKFPKPRDPKNVLDMEGLAILPWGNILISTEGDLNKKPRVNPRLFEVKVDGTYVRDYEVPESFLPEPTGLQKNGIGDNKGFEGLTSWKGEFWLATEEPLKQDRSLHKTKSFIRMIQYKMPQAWVLKPSAQGLYPLGSDSPDQGISLVGVSSILPLNTKELLVLERAAELDITGVHFRSKIYKVEMNLFEQEAAMLKQNLEVLSKKLVIDLAKAFPDKEQDNFEGLAWGPTLKTGEKTLLIISDDNFSKHQKSLIWVLKLANVDKK